MRNLHGLRKKVLKFTFVCTETAEKWRAAGFCDTGEG
jgi:hypothetical protein